MKIPNNQLFELVEDSVAEGRSVVVNAVGNSMLPFIRGGRDSVRFTPIETPEIGDIVLFRYNGTHIMHRIIKISGETITAQGDGLKGTTETFRREDLIARVSQIIKPNRVVDTSTANFRFRSRIWQSLLPFRGYLIRLLMLIKS